MEGIPHPIPRTVEEVFSDFRGRRAGLIKALTNDVQKFYQLCDPEKENLCLYGLPNETWEVNLPVEEVPPELPEPALGINFARDGMQEKDWLSLVAVHSDSWLLAVAFYFGARFGFGKNESRGVTVNAAFRVSFSKKSSCAGGFGLVTDAPKFGE
ncbi:hypothetical protein C1H46_037394 [Malus baccata]|uniref:PHD finger protein ALFIN-LIKE n=1 Tax=Malus baccata TaxID=106549 RepID=A0A540KSC2_MALBA|nr:hypothetical protein C1H46_037394 [Malus baccata]